VPTPQAIIILYTCNMPIVGVLYLE